MVIDIFRLDWIFIDTVIIILLLLVLISVKLFKERSRWRASLSNEILESINYRKSDIPLKSQYFNIKNLSFVRNISIKKQINSKPIIIISKTTKKRKLLYVLTEGLASYGFNVIIVDFKVALDYDNLVFDNNMQKERENIFSDIINIFIEKDFISNSNYILINYLKLSFLQNSTLSDPKNRGIFLLNPNFKSIIIGNFSEASTLNDLKSPIYVIFSKNLSLFIPNKNLKKFLKVFNNETSRVFKLITLEKAKRSFKYYETILLGIIIYLINNNLLKD
ncbi:MAG: hypothetical protein ACFE8A_10875 [Candidatus Hodarchaeota archaeon]